MKKLNLAWLLLLSFVLLAACSDSEKATKEDPAPQSEEGKEEATADTELEMARAMFEPLGEMVVPVDNPMTDEKIALGQMLYFDERLSGNNKLSCASCHAVGAGYGDGLPKFIGFEGFNGPRNSPTILNAGYYKENFWDGRAVGLEAQAVGPIQSEVEMNQNLDELVVELSAVQGYVDEFNKVFNEPISADNIAKAIAAFERTIVIKDTAFDKFLAGDDNAISAEAKEGLKLFVGKASCISCHAGPLLSDHNYHNLGIDDDGGRFAVTGVEVDKGKFRTSGLRGVAHTAPFMHDGSLATLEEVVNYYNVGGGTHANKSEQMRQLNLNAEEVSYLVAFLESMSGEVPQYSKPDLPQ